MEPIPTTENKVIFFSFNPVLFLSSPSELSVGLPSGLPIIWPSGWPGGAWPASIIAYCMIGVPGLKVAKYNEEINLLFLLLMTSFCHSALSIRIEHF